MKNRRGQSTIEYLLLTAAVMFLVYSVYNSNLFRETFLGDGEMMALIKQKMELHYRHASGNISSLSESINNSTTKYDNYQGNHESYFNKGTNESRFFISTQPYPRD